MFSKLRRRTANNPSSAPLSHLLKSNDPPSNAEETLIRNTIQAMRGEITTLRLKTGNHLAPPGSFTTLAKDREAAIIKNITAHESIISPLRKFPTELLQVIFLQTHWDPQTTSTLPWFLSQVCRSWRMIVHDMPVLWSHITIYFNTKPTILRSQEDRLKLILQRSGNVDLWISISGIMNQGDKHPSLSLLLILMTQSERWRYLNLTMTAETVMAFQDVKSRLPRLSRLHLKIWKTKDPMTVDIFSIAPRLENVRLDHNGIDRIRVIVPLHQLSSYTRKNVPDERGRFGISPAAFSNLVYLETRWNSESTYGGAVVNPLEPRITLPCLEVLVIAFSAFYAAHHPDPAEVIFERLILFPSGKIFVRDQARGAVLAISAMISRSLPCNLCTLSVTTTAVAWSGHLTSLLYLTPQLEHLEIPRPPDRDLSNHLAASESPVLAPKLQSLHILMLPSSLPFYCPVGPSVMISEMLSNAEGFRPRTLQLRFTIQSACHVGYFAIQPSPPVGELDDEVLFLINSWKNRLVKGIPHVSHRPTPRKMLINLMHWRRLDQLFSTIEGYDIPTSGYLHVSKLHFVMYAIGRSETSLVPGNKCYGFCGRAKALLARWEPILLQDVHYYQWLNTHPTTLTYVPKRAEFRESSNAIDLVYSHAAMHKFNEDACFCVADDGVWRL